MVERGEFPPSSLRPTGSFHLPPDQPIDVRRSLDALRRARGVIALVVIATTVAVVMISLYLPKTYRATTTLWLNQTTSPFGQQDVSIVERNLETLRQLISTRKVLDTAARRIPGQTASSLGKKISASVDSSANIISISAVGSRPRGVALVVNSVASAFLEQQAKDVRRELAAAQAQLEERLRTARATGASQQELDALNQRIADITLALADPGSDLEVAQSAEPPTASYTPRPVRNGVLAFFASLFLTILAALARDRLVPRLSNAREVSRLLGLPLLVGVPFVRRRFGRRSKMERAIANEAYQTLQASVRFHLPPTKQRVLLITSAVEGEGKTSVAAGLARALARVDEKTLLVSADLRFPTLHELFKTPAAPGLSDILVAAESEGSGQILIPAEIQQTITPVFGGVGDNLHVLPSGTRVPDPAKLLFSDGLAAFFSALEKLDYSYVVVDGPPLLGVADGHALAPRADDAIVVSRPERSTVEDLSELRYMLERLEVETLGVVVVGTRRSVTYAYAAYAGTSAADELPRGRVSA